MSTAKGFTTHHILRNTCQIFHVFNEYCKRIYYTVRHATRVAVCVLAYFTQSFHKECRHHCGAMNKGWFLHISKITEYYLMRCNLIE